MEDVSRELHMLELVLGELAVDAAGDDGEVYSCRLCRDSGYVVKGGRAAVCSCRLPQIISARKVAAGLTPRLQQMSFDNFSLSLYPETMRTPQGAKYRQVAEKVLRNARAFARDCAKQKLPPGMLISGAVGSGKTHLAAAIANSLAEQDIDFQFLVVPEFLDQLRASYRQEKEGLDESKIIKRAYDVPVLFLDDMGAHNFTDWVENKVFTIINHRYNNQLPTVITTNLDMDVLDEKLGERTVSRLIEACALYTLYIDCDLRQKQNPTGRKL